MVGTQTSEHVNCSSYHALVHVRTSSTIHRARILWVTGLVVLLVLAVLAHGNAQFPGDAAIWGLLKPWHHSLIAPVIEFPSNTNQPTLGAILVVVIVTILAVLRYVREALAAAVGTLVSDLVNALMNGLVARPRPSNVHVPTISGLGAHSFPSGHVEHVTVLFGFLFYLTVLAVYARPARRAWLLPIQMLCVYFVAFIGVGRIVEGDHQPSDVLAGYLVAALMLPLVVALYRWLGDVWQHHRWRRGGQLALHKSSS